MGVETWENEREEIAKEEEEEARKSRAEVEGGNLKLGKDGKGAGEVVWERLWENQRG